MKNYLMATKRALRRLGTPRRHQSSPGLSACLANTSSFSTFSSLSPNFYLPQTSSSISLDNLRFIVNDIVLNKRMSILEFGAGASTVLIANLIARNGLTTSFFSVEENPQWLELVDDWLRLAGVAHHVRLINAPIVENKQSGLSTWYDQDAIKSRLRSEEKFDCVVVDGPTAYSADAIGRRRPAGAWLRDRLAGSAAIFVDDIDRDGEWDMVKDWNQHYGWKFHQLSPSLGVFRFGQAHNIV